MRTDKLGRFPVADVANAVTQKDIHTLSRTVCALIYALLQTLEHLHRPLEPGGQIVVRVRGVSY